MQQGFRFQQQRSTLHRREWRPANDSSNHVSGTQLLLKPCIDFPQPLDDPHILFTEGHSLQSDGWHVNSFHHFPQLLDDPHIMFTEGHSLQSDGWHVNSIHQNGWHNIEKLPINSKNDFKVLHSFREVHVPVRTRVVKVVKYDYHTSANNSHHQQVCSTGHRGYQKGPRLMDGFEEETSEVVKVCIKN